MKTAIIDLGTNTFHLLIVEDLKILFKTSVPAKIGMGGISKGVISEEGIQRALVVLRGFREIIQSQSVSIEKVFATGTSAIRNAGNKEEFIKKVLDETGIKINIISGEEEAELISLGVKKAMKIPETSMIMDIGGGSVEFIICNDEKVFWKQSFEIGGQRLIDKFIKSDPISMRSVQIMDDFFREKLLPLANACHQYAPKVLIGSSGSFDTLIDMQFMKEKGQLPATDEIAFDYSITAFYWAYNELIFKNQAERMQIPGMIELRVDMIVVAICMIRFVIQTHDIQSIKVSSYALKEGIMARIMS
jgi:exopolyphosphatase/guanosine-5'-triphosphate,3'-diphosphate pyrophosphatase